MISVLILNVKALLHMKQISKMRALKITLRKRIALCQTLTAIVLGVTNIQSTKLPKEIFCLAILINVPSVAMELYSADTVHIWQKVRQVKIHYSK